MANLLTLKVTKVTILSLFTILSFYAEATIRKASEVFIGTVEIKQDLVTGHYDAHVTTLNGQKHILPLVQIRVDPWHNKQGKKSL